MTLRVGLQMDPIAAIKIAGDSSFALALEAQKRGHELFYYEPDRLALRENLLTAQVQKLKVADIEGAHFELAAPHRMDLSRLDVVLMRQDPPFDMKYISATHFLEAIHPQTLVVNNPVAVRNAPEKILPTLFDGLLPPTVMTRDKQVLADFRAEFSDIIIKPLYGNAGAGIFHLRRDDENFAALLDVMLTHSRDPIIAQAFLPQVKDGDKRIILVEGDAVGAFNRVPRKGEIRANLAAGGTAEATQLTDRDLQIVAQIGSTLKAQGIMLAGIDVIGDYLTEINITSPTGLREIKALGGGDIAALLWDAIETKCANNANI